MVDILFRSPLMNVLSQPLVIPTTHQRRLIGSPRSPMFLNAAPIAVSNKIRAIQARKTRITLITSDAVHTDIRPLNFSCKSGVAKSRTDYSVVTAEKLVDRSKDIRLDRISARQQSRPSVVLNTNNNQPNIFWSNYQQSSKYNKQNPTQSNSTARTPPGHESAKAKSPMRKMPDIPRRQPRQTSIDRPDPLLTVEIKERSKSKPQPTRASRIKSHDRLIHHNNIRANDNEEDDDNGNNPLMDEEFEEYLEKAIVKCADWLIKYVFI
ncbi:hypothetical protein I4U23_001993 [Adineta vaga]|nr:hypothetical protein I4U23_001993 [Adineta vaga]